MTDAGSDPTPAEIMNGALEATIPVAHGMGVQATDLRRGFAATTVPIEGNGNHFGVMYAGVLFTVAEILGGALALMSFDSSKYYPLVKEVTITFKRPATTDVRAEAALDDETIARVADEAGARGKSDYQVDAVVTDENGETVAVTHAVCQLRAQHA